MMVQSEFGEEFMVKENHIETISKPFRLNIHIPVNLPFSPTSYPYVETIPTELSLPCSTARPAAKEMPKAS